MATQRIRGVTVYVEERGASDLSLVFLHYWGGTHRTWDKVVAELGGKYHTVTYDMRGCGSSDPAISGYSIPELADDAAALIDQMGLRKYVLVGHSMGGKIAQLLASRRPNDLVGLILVAPATPTPTQLPQEVREQLLHAYDNRETVLRNIPMLSAKSLDAAIIDQIVQDSLSLAPAFKQAWPTIGMQEDISVEVENIAVPTLLLAGEADRVDSVDQHRREVLTRIPNAHMQIIPNSGHLIMVDEPSLLSDAIHAFAAA